MECLCYFIVFIIATFELEGFELSPCGYRLCTERCIHISQCQTIEFSSISLTCKSWEFNSPKNHTDRIYVNVSTWPKPCAHFRCKRSSRCVVTRRSGVKCVPPARTERQGGAEVMIRPVTGSRSKILLRKTHKMKSKITGFIATVGLDVIKLQLFYLNTRLPTVQSKSFAGRILDMKTWGNNIYWCQEKPTKCVRVEFTPRTRTFHIGNETGVAGLTVAVDEAAGMVFIGGFQTAVFKTDLHFRTKDITSVKKQPHILQACHKSRLLYIGYGTNSVGMYTYKGVFLKDIKVLHQVEAMDVSPGGDLYTTDSVGHLSVVTRQTANKPGVHVQKTDLPHNTNPNVFAYKSHGLLMINEKKILSLEASSYKVVYLHVKPPIKRSDRVRYAAFYGKHQHFMHQGAHDSLKVRKDCILGNESLVLATATFPSSRECTRLTKIHLKTGKPSVMEFIEAKLVYLDVDKSVCYWCQTGPTGIHRYAIGSTFDFIPLLKERCHAIAGDTSLNFIFYATTDHLTRYSIDNSSKKLLDIYKKNTDISQMQVFLDRRERIVYVSLGRGKNIFWSNYDLEKRRTFASYQRSKVFTISNDGKFYYTNARSDTVRPGEIITSSWRRLEYLSKKLKIYRVIKRVILVGNKIIVELKTSVKVFCKENFKEIKVPLPWLHLKRRSNLMVGVN